MLVDSGNLAGLSSSFLITIGRQDSEQTGDSDFLDMSPDNNDST